MSLFIFTRKILAGEPIKVFNYGHHARDFTYVDDAVEGVVRTLDIVATPDPEWRPEAPDAATSSAPYRIYNIGNHSPVALLDFIAMVEKRDWAEGQDRAASRAARRRRGDLCRCRGAAAGDRVSPGHAARGGHQALRRVVPRLLRA